MGSVTVFVDDAVRGDFPPVCARTGRDADMTLVVTATVRRGLQPAWILLVLLGPVGWVAMIVLLALAPSREEITVRVPYTDEAYRRSRASHALWAVALVIGGVAWAAMGFVFGLSGVGLAAAGIGLVVAVVARVAAHRSSVRVSLDGSRRWVTLSRVHDRFVDAVVASGASLRSRSGAPTTP